MQIGRIILVNASDGSNEYRGHLATLKFQLPRFAMRPIRDPAASEDAPKWEVVARIDGADIVCGQGWNKVISKGENEGKRFFNLSIDDPSFDRPFYVSAFPSKQAGPNDEEAFDIVWRRPRPRDGAAGSGPAGAGGEGESDEIPF